VLLQFNRDISVHVFGDSGYARPLALVALAIPLFTVIRVISAVFRGYSKPRERVLFQGLLRNGSFLALLVVVVSVELDHLAAIQMLPLSLGLTVALYFGYLYRDNPGRFRDDVVDRLSQMAVPVSLIRFSAPLMVATLLLQLMTWMDILMLGYFSTSRAVGLYDGVRPLVRIIPIVWQGMIFMYIPLVSGMYARDNLNAIRRVYFVLTKWFASATVPLVLLFLFFPASTLRVVFGSTFTVAAPALQLLAVAFCAGNLLGPTGATLIAMGHTRVVMGINLVSAIVNFGLNIALIPEYDLIGAAIATAIAVVLRNLLRLAMLYRRGRIHALRSAIYWPLFLTTAAAGCLSLALGTVSWAMLLCVFTATAVILLASFPLTSSISPEDDILLSRTLTMIRRVTQ
jgi:O-antigen/teichoic acid export membrane protein